MPRFVILEHDHPCLHWDLMLDAGAGLKTWRLAKVPDKIGEWIEALPLADHREFYLDYEGPISGDRGHVLRWDYGEYEVLAALVGEVLRVRLMGQKVRGIAILSALESQWFFRIES